MPKRYNTGKTPGGPTNRHKQFGRQGHKFQFTQKMAVISRNCRRVPRLGSLSGSPAAMLRRADLLQSFGRCFVVRYYHSASVQTMNILGQTLCKSSTAAHWDFK